MEQYSRRLVFSLITQLPMIQVKVKHIPLNNLSSCLPSIPSIQILDVPDISYTHHAMFKQVTAKQLHPPTDIQLTPETCS
jgi:hypothetical protein